jgi:hypothetical protein
MNWKRPVPLWVFFIGVIVTASVTSGAFLLPSLLAPKPDFIISDLPPMLLYSTNTTLVSVQAIRNFTGIVTVTVVSPAGLNTALQDPRTGQEKEQILLGKTGNLSLAVTHSRNGVGYFSVAVTASSGWISHTKNLIVIVQNLTMTAVGGSYLWIPRGSSRNVELDLSSVNGLSGNVSFWTNVYGDCCSGTNGGGPSNASFNPGSIILSPRGTGTTTLTINVAQSDTSSHITVEAWATTKQTWSFRLYLWVTVV